MNKAEIEKLLVWLLPVILIAVLANAALLQIINEMLSQVGTTVTQSVEDMSWMDRNLTQGEQITYLNILKTLPNILVRLIIGAWLYFQVKNLGGRRWLWAASGLLLQYWGLAIFFFAQLLERKSNGIQTSNS